MTRRKALALFASSALRATNAHSYQTPYKLNRLVLAGSGVKGDFDEKAVDCPFVFHHQGRFYMTYIGFDGTGYQTGLASSDDLVNWRREGCILRRDPSSAVTRYNIAMNWIVRENAIASPGALKRVRGRFLGAYHAYPNAGYEQGPAVIGLCWSRDLRNWQLDRPCLDAESGAAWERGGLYKPCLVEHAGMFYLFYNAKTQEKRWHEQTGVATSRDLTKWTRYAANPILRNGTEATWDDRFASDPCVLLDGHRWLLFYFGLDSAGKARDLLATGSGPFEFAKSGEILVDIGPPGSVDSTYAHKPSLISHGGALYHFYCAVSGKWPNEVRGISVARSKPW
ncbi:MAG TPA: family 43 glycosylhydrolase [Bryobacteraceae bacterium]|jgi:predicted GH43/DUF377 family glycosyl hydrolase|nr:family 43 glycosylhydrolase [Bryobacteraceae bacterium]